MTAALPHLVRLRAEELVATSVDRLRSPLVPSPARLARSVARVVLAHAEYLDRALIAVPSTVAIHLPAAAAERIAGARSTLEREIATTAWHIVSHSRPPLSSPVATPFTVRIVTDPGRSSGSSVRASRRLAPIGPATEAARVAATSVGPEAEVAATATAIADDPMVARLRLRAQRGPETLTIEPGQPARLGRSTANDLVVSDDRASGRHAAISWDGPQPKLRDLGSTNGTWVNERRVGETGLDDGDRVRLGRTVFVVDLIGAPTASPCTAAVDCAPPAAAVGCGPPHAALS